uniref:cholesterol side-chain cleavage enzyme, mitochondrial-like n=1 Tax=Myxine glutinosa TaxID=7769 RepID=UPI00358F9A96
MSLLLAISCSKVIIERLATNQEIASQQCIALSLMVLGKKKDGGGMGATLTHGGDRRGPRAERERLEEPSEPLVAGRLPAAAQIHGASVRHFWAHLPHVISKGFGWIRVKPGGQHGERIGAQDTVNVYLPGDSARLFMVEGITPERMVVRPWLAYRHYRQRSRGVLLKSGEDWRQTRLALNHDIIAPKALPPLLPPLQSVCNEFVSRLHSISRPDIPLPDLSNELFKFALESICRVLYGERMGLLGDTVPADAERFIQAITEMFRTSVPMLFIPPELLRLLSVPLWKKHMNAWDDIFLHAEKHIKKVLSLRNAKDCEAKPPHLLENIVTRGRLNLEDITASATELMAGAVDTTSITIQWALWELAGKPELQELLRQEVQRAWQILHAGDAQGSPETLSKLLKDSPLVRMTIKETLRLHPVAVTLQRYLAHDVTIQGYTIPSGTLAQASLWTMGRHPDIFEDPEVFSPKRWLRDIHGEASPFSKAGSHKDEAERPDEGVANWSDGNEETMKSIGSTSLGPCNGAGVGNTFLALGFGFGPRQCLGRRIAESEMGLLLINILRNFRIRRFDDTQVDTHFELILLPSRPIQLVFEPIESENSNL